MIVVTDGSTRAAPEHSKGGPRPFCLEAIATRSEEPQPSPPASRSFRCARRSELTEGGPSRLETSPPPFFVGLQTRAAEFYSKTR